ncbi:MAG TPA: TMEM175 family protein [Phototrophicaceae bacterium]|nr:TMEM175 family protein [Phototrophicaceae bacterium]
MADQTEHKSDEYGDELGFERLVFFSDAVMAIAITLMALEIHLPELEPNATTDQVNAAFQTIIPHIGVYALSFVVIGIYWVVHHRLFRIIRRYDLTLIWLNLIFLMLIAFLPVATNALGSYSNTVLITDFYSASIALIGFSEFALWFYALRKNYMPPLAHPRGSLYFGLRVLTPPAVFLLSILIAAFNVNLAQISWVLIVPVSIVLRLIFRAEDAERDPYSQGERK